MAEVTNFNISHNKAMHRFETEIDGKIAYLRYVMEGDSISFVHTFTPDALRGKGIASAVVKFGLNYAKENKLRVIIGCSFVAEYIKLHPEYQALLK